LNFVRSDVVARYLIAATALMAGLYLAIHHHQETLVEQAGTLITQGQFELAGAKASEVTDSPSATMALYRQGLAAAGLGRNAEAIAFFQRAEVRDPNNWVIHRDWAVSLLAAGDRVHARRQMRRALQLNPLMALPARFVR
jgi:Flp pilus assembly protein TadD